MFRKSISLIAILILFSAFTSSQAQDTTSLAGKYALQFQVSQNFTLSNFLGSVISGKYHFTNESAVRVGLGLSASMNNQTSGQESQSGVLESNAQSIDLTTQYMITPVISENVRFYFGAGPKLGLNYSKYDNVTNPSNHSQTSEKASTKGYSVGVLCSAGVEWFFMNRMSLCAEYGLTYVYSYSKINRNYNKSVSTEQKTYNYSFNGNDVRFGLSVYF